VRSIPFFRQFFALACLAIALVAVAPVISRALASTPGGVPPLTMETSVSTPPHGAAHRMPEPLHAQGHAHASPHDVTSDVAPHDATAHAAHHTLSSSAGDPHASHEMGVDCDYCLIAARMMGLLVALLLMLIAWPAAAKPFCAPRFAARTDVSGTLGARGPPQAIAG